MSGGTKHPDAYMFNWQHGRILQEYQIIYITRGKGLFDSKALGRKKIEEGTIFFLFPGIWHRYKPNQNTGWIEHWVSFDGIQPKTFQEHGIISPENAIIEIGLDEKTIQLYQQILELIDSEKIGYKEMIATLTYQIIAQVSAKEKSKKFIGKDIETSIQKAKAYMIDRIDKQINFVELAYELSIGYSWFRRMFRRYTGLVPIQYFLQLKLNKAKELLVSTSLPIKEISIITGFESQYYFSKFFKKRTEMSPMQLREYSRGKG